jgi:hypothetical protein
MYGLYVVGTRVELLPCFKFTGKTVKIKEFTGKIGKAGKRLRGELYLSCDKQIQWEYIV